MSIDLRRISEESHKNKDMFFDRLFESVSEEIYSDQTHFILELLQNAEDSIRRRGKEWSRRTIEFSLFHDHLRISHFGVPFNKDDVRAICSIRESTKDELTDIGRFGMGFKSVYRYTEQPVIHSGSGDYSVNFVINKRIYPEEILPLDRDPDETIFLLPFKSDKEYECYEEIAEGLETLGASKLLFLREIDKIKITIKDYYTGSDYISRFCRRESENIDNNVRHVKLFEETNEEEPIYEEWLIFSRPLPDKGALAVEIGFFVTPNSNTIQPVNYSYLVVYFPTGEETRLGFVVQGPYQTTLSRESIPPAKNNEWNKNLVKETAKLLHEALCWMRDARELDTNALRCLPLQQIHGRFEGYYSFVKELLKSERLLPALEGGYISASEALLSRSQKVRELLSLEQISMIYDLDKEPAWLDSNITRERTRDIYDYFIHELNVREITPEGLLRQLDRKFLEEQSEEWLIQFYVFLDERKGLYNLFKNLPIIRLSNGNHITPNPEKVFLPIDKRTDFPTVHKNICNEDTIAFLNYLGLREPNLVDDVIRNVLPKYQDRDEFKNIDLIEYERDIKRITHAYDTDSRTQKGRLLDELSQTNFVMSLDTNNVSSLQKPRQLYIRTERLNELFTGVDRVRFIDDHNCPFLSQEPVITILKRCGVISYLNPIRKDMLEEKKKRLRDQGQTPAVRSERFTDWNLQELEQIIVKISSADLERQKRRSKFLWEELIYMRKLRPEIFEATYTWDYYTRTYENAVEAAFIELLNNTAWVPDIDDKLKPPSDIIFDNLGWEDDLFLLDMIKFKLPYLDQALKEADIDPNWLRVIARLEKQGKTPGDFLPSEQGKDNNNLSGEESGREPTYAEKISESMTPDPSPGPQKGVIYPLGGPKTTESAIQDIRRLAESKRTEGHERLTITSEPDQNTKVQSVKNEDKLRGDYRERCQICGSTFLTRAGNLNIFAPHTVKPKQHSLTNHFGNLLSLCAWHYALLDYGQWALLDPETEEPIDKENLPEQLLNLLQDNSRVTVSDEGPHINIPIRFSNLYLHWNTSPEEKIEEIRFTLPHRENFCQLLMSEETSDD